MNAFEIPISPLINQSFSIMFRVNAYYWLRLYWVEANEAGWTLDIGLSATEPLVCGIPVLPGRNLLDDYPELHLPLIIFIDTPGNQKKAPAFEDLGIMTKLYYALAPIND